MTDNGEGQQPRSPGAQKKSGKTKRRVKGSLLPNKSPSDTDTGWSEPSERVSLREYYEREKPPHWSQD